MPIPNTWLALCCGTCTGVYFCGTFVPFHGAVYALLVLTFDAASLFLVHLWWPRCVDADRKDPCA